MVWGGGWGRGGGKKVCLSHQGHIIKMAAMPIYGKNTLKIFFSGIKGPMTLWLSMQHLYMGPVKFEKNDSLG